MTTGEEAEDAAARTATAGLEAAGHTAACAERLVYANEECTRARAEATEPAPGDEDPPSEEVHGCDQEHEELDDGWWAAVEQHAPGTVDDG